MSTATVSAGYYSELLDFAVACGAPRVELLQRAQVREEQLENPDTRLPLDSYKETMWAAKELTGDAALALKLGAHRDLDKISVVGLMSYSAANMAEALEQLNRFGHLVIELDLPKPDERFLVLSDEHEAWLIDTRLYPDSFQELTESTWARFVAETSRNFPGVPFVKEVHVTHPRPAYADAYKDFMGVPVVFASDKNALRFHATWPAVKLNAPNAYMLGVLSEHAQRLLAELQASKTVRGQVENLMLPDLHRGVLDMAALAEKLGMTRQTLYRKLKQENTSFEQMVDELRHKMAQHYLNGRKVSVNETAYLVGFSDPSSFSKAFKRWTGQSPRAYMQGLEKP